MCIYAVKVFFIDSLAGSTALDQNAQMYRLIESYYVLVWHNVLVSLMGLYKPEVHFPTAVKAVLLTVAPWASKGQQGNGTPMTHRFC